MEKKGKVVFKRYAQNPPMLVPPSYEDLVPENHPVRVKRIDIGSLERGYKGGGTSSYHPRTSTSISTALDTHRRA